MQINIVVGSMENDDDYQLKGGSSKNLHFRNTDLQKHFGQI